MGAAQCCKAVSGLMPAEWLNFTEQGKQVDDESANAGAVKAKQTRQARQYMNRRGGFNRPLPAEKTGEKITAS